MLLCKSLCGCGSSWQHCAITGDQHMLGFGEQCIVHLQLQPLQCTKHAIHVNLVKIFLERAVVHDSSDLYTETPIGSVVYRRT